MAKKKIIIIGGGMSALVCAVLLARGGTKVLLLEKNDKLGKKILVTGNGRCNLGNRYVSQEHYHSRTKNLFSTVYEQFPLESSLAFFDSIGIPVVELEEGKLYPQSLQAASVVKGFLFELERLGVEIQYSVEIQKIEYTNKFKVQTNIGSYYANGLVIATGGNSYGNLGTTGDGYNYAKQFGHTIIKPYQSIVQLKTTGTYNKALKGVKLDAMARLIERDSKALIREEFGEVLFTEYGLSGPPILQLSTLVYPKIEKTSLSIVLDFFPQYSDEELDQLMCDRFHSLSYRSVADALNGFLNQRLIVPLLKYSEMDPLKKAAHITRAEREIFVRTLKKYQEEVSDTYIWSQAQVTKGGVSCLEINPLTLESQKQNSLYFCGEVVDMDGDCGGFNLQWAISSGACIAKNLLSSS
ncbi:MAG: NAD(P)/FAD-dependent oxidoreductase [Vallitaleaceae bacterium]|nr:NAD(P)/FAD-dependent oxidoreductase [Vallitaleaceae bacterium]